MGQKVLANLVVRLALAESFSIRCGVMALDEPTTNLDKDHIRNLANSFNKLIEYKKSLGLFNFQLIIITHDQDFINLLKGNTNYYHKIFKVNFGFKNKKIFVEKN